MVLTLLPAGWCRLCWHNLHEGNFHCRAIWIGDTGIPVRARRTVMPEVCDDCWQCFANWCARKLGEERRKAQFSDVGRHNSRGTVQRREVAMSYSEARAEKLYGRFSQHAVDEWLTAAMQKNAKDLMGKATAPVKEQALLEMSSTFRRGRGREFPKVRQSP